MCHCCAVSAESFYLLLDHCQVLNCDRYAISPCWMLLAIPCWSCSLYRKTAFCDLSVCNPHNDQPGRHAYYTIWQWWDNAAAHVRNIAIGTQSPKTLYGCVMVVISLSEYSVDWSHTIYEIDFFCNYSFLSNLEFCQRMKSVPSDTTYCHWEYID